MNVRRFAAAVSAVALFALIAAAAPVLAKSEVKGAAILDHPCGKVAVENMGLVHDGKIAEAMKLGTQAMQDEWNKMPAKDKEMMGGMMKEMSQTREAFSAEIKANGVLFVEGKSATLKVTKTTKDANGSSSETMTQNFELDGTTCRITR
ncbi:MAG: hypothetical protein U0X73_17095 [Thermoanaerobaculia bacterium]